MYMQFTLPGISIYFFIEQNHLGCDGIFSEKRKTSKEAEEGETLNVYDDVCLLLLVAE